MGVLDRLYEWQIGALAIYPNAEDPGDLNPASPVYDFLSLYDRFRIRMEGQDHENRATGEKRSYPIPVSEAFLIDVAGTVEGVTLLQLAMNSGRGPYWCWFQNGNGSSFRGRVLISGAEFGTDGGPQTQACSLKVQGDFVTGFIGPDS